MVESNEEQPAYIENSRIQPGARIVPDNLAGWLVFRARLMQRFGESLTHFFEGYFFVVSLASIILWTQLQPSVQSSRASATFCPSNRPSCHHCVTCCDPGIIAIVITPAPHLSSSFVGSNTIWEKEEERWQSGGHGRAKK